ncbi:xanthine dehydrogenase family protein subunit M, partial [Actinomadura bangladeshensis]|nr:xanthine dehydrogenase family protein subunit M [Actinomadura bangladeshensis]
TLDEDLRVAAARAGYLGIAATPLVFDLAGAAGPNGDWAAAAAHVRDRIDPEPDIHAGVAYRRHLTGVLTERALRAAAAEALRKAED